MISVKKIKVDDTYQIRRDVLRENIDLPYTFTGDLDKNTYHFGLFVDDLLVSVVSFMKNNYKDLDGQQMQLRGMATKKEFQGNGLGRILVKKCEEIWIDKNIKFIWCNARIKALNFYKRLGFYTVGKEFNIPLIGAHYVMVKKIES